MISNLEGSYGAVRWSLGYLVKFLVNFGVISLSLPKVLEFQLSLSVKIELYMILES